MSKTYEAIKAREAAKREPEPKPTKRKAKRPKPVEASQTVAKIKDDEEG